MVHHPTGRPTGEITSMNISLNDGLDESRTTYFVISSCGGTRNSYLPFPVDLAEVKLRIKTSIGGLDSDFLTRLRTKMDNLHNMDRTTKCLHVEHL
ncbi:hypothetical protein TNCV_4922341 [Trichonephila clavipes]|nr:hypothetical protein TNCV_4922341 [Trichonephila clavipes]